MPFLTREFFSFRGERAGRRRTHQPDLRARLSLNSLEVLEDRCTPSVSPVDLGVADEFGVLALQRTDIDNQNAVISGNVGVSRRGSLQNNRQSIITGNVDEFAARQYSGRGQVGGSIIVDSALMNQADQDAQNASALASALSATQTFRNISRATTITGNGGVNVINIRGDITASLTLSGTADDLFIVNVRGSLSLRGSESLLLGGGVTAGNVLYNFTDRNSSVSVRAGSVNGTVLAPRSDVDLRGTTVNGEIIAGGGSINLSGGAHVNFVPFAPPPPPPPPPPPSQGTASLGGRAYVFSPFGSGDPWGGLGVTLTGTDDLGNAVFLQTTTDSDGNYSFAELRAGQYTIAFDQTGFSGSAAVGTVNGASDGTVVDAFTIGAISLANDNQGVDYNFVFAPIS